MAFRFKQFTVEDDRSTMRIGTDARRNRARHTTNLSRQELLAGIKHLLHDDGIF